MQAFILISSSYFLIQSGVISGSYLCYICSNLCLCLSPHDKPPFRLLKFTIDYVYDVNNPRLPCRCLFKYFAKNWSPLPTFAKKLFRFLPYFLATTICHCLIPTLNPHCGVPIPTAQTMKPGPHTEGNFKLMLYQRKNNNLSFIYLFLYWSHAWW
jgi:hypothetical protein